MNIIATIYDRSLYETADLRITSPAQLLDPIAYSQCLQEMNRDISKQKILSLIRSVALAIFGSMVLMITFDVMPLFATGAKQAVGALMMDCSFKNFTAVVESSRKFFCACSLTVMSWQVCRWSYQKLPTLSSLLERFPSPVEFKTKLDQLKNEIKNCKQTWDTSISAISPDALKLLSVDALKTISPGAVRAMSEEDLKAVFGTPEGIATDALKEMALKALEFKAYKRQISAICAKLCAQYSIHQDRRGTYGITIDVELNKAREDVTEILEGVASKEDVDHSDAYEHTPLFVLYTLGLRHTKQLMEDQHWIQSIDSLDEPRQPLVGWLDLKFAEKGIFSRRQLEKKAYVNDLKIDSDGTKKETFNLALTMNRIRSILTASHELKLPPAIIKIDRVASTLFAKVFKILSFFPEAMNIMDVSSFFVGMWIGVYGHKITRETRHFVNGSLLYRLLWLGTASPTLCLGNVVGLTLRDRQWKAFPRKFYQAYVV